MDLRNAVLLLTHQAAVGVDYGFVVGLIAVMIACASLFYRERMSQHLRQTGERHDKLQIRHFNPSQRVIVQRPEELDAKESSTPAKTNRKPHPWRSQH
jgi:hypothetical protein